MPTTTRRGGVTGAGLLLLPSSEKFKTLVEVATPQSDEAPSPTCGFGEATTNENTSRRGSRQDGENPNVLIDGNTISLEGLPTEEGGLTNRRRQRESFTRMMMLQQADENSDEQEGVNRDRSQSITALCVNESREYWRRAELACDQLVDLVRQDSFRFLRLSVSVLILVFSLLFFLLTFFQDEDFYESLFHVVKNYVFVNNPTSNLRAN